MKVIFVSGAYRGNTPNEIWENIMRARQVAGQLWGKGFVVICPHTNSLLMDGLVSPEVFLEGGIELLKRCDCILMMKGWGTSLGAVAEHKVAKEKGLEVFYEV